MKETLKHLPWKLILILALLLMIRPVLSILGVFDRLGSWAPPVVTILVDISWLVIAVKQRLKRPVLTLAMAGVAYGVISTLLAIVIQSFQPSPEAPSIAILATGVLLANVLINGVWGAALGFLASLFVRVNTSDKGNKKHQPKS